MRGAGSALFVGILLLIAGVLNIIYGIAALDDKSFYTSSQFIFSGLHTWGWITIILGAIQIMATALITVLAARSKDAPCPVHRSRQPAVRTATGTGTSGPEPGSWGPSGHLVAESATSVGRGGVLGAYIPLLGPHSYDVSGFQATHLRGRT